MNQARNRKESMSCRGPAYDWKEFGALEELKEVLVEFTELWETGVKQDWICHQGPSKAESSRNVSFIPSVLGRPGA